MQCGILPAGFSHVILFNMRRCIILITQTQHIPQVQSLLLEMLLPLDALSVVSTTFIPTASLPSTDDLWHVSLSETGPLFSESIQVCKTFTLIKPELRSLTTL